MVSFEGRTRFSSLASVTVLFPRYDLNREPATSFLSVGKKGEGLEEKRKAWCCSLLRANPYMRGSYIDCVTSTTTWVVLCCHMSKEDSRGCRMVDSREDGTRGERV